MELKSNGDNYDYENTILQTEVQREPDNEILKQERELHKLRLCIF